DTVLIRAANEVLRDREKAVQLLEEIPKPSYFEFNYVAALALVRAVGHVLDKVDANENGPRPGLSVDVAYAKWKANRDEHRIFWEFIEEERNNILKEYTFGFVS